MGDVVSWLVHLLVHDAQQLTTSGQSHLPVFSIQELQDKQQQDPSLSKVLSFLIRGRLPSRRERAHETDNVLRMLKQWYKLKMLDGLLYRVSKDQLPGKKRYQYVVPASLAKQVLQGIHDDADHRGSREHYIW